MTCERATYDLFNDPYNRLTGKREDYPCTCGQCPVEEIRHGGFNDLPAIMPDSYESKNGLITPKGM